MYHYPAIWIHLEEGGLHQKAQIGKVLRFSPACGRKGNFFLMLIAPDHLNVSWNECAGDQKQVHCLNQHK